LFFDTACLVSPYVFNALFLRKKRQGSVNT